MRIAVASDHAALSMKRDLAAWLRELGHEVLDLGPDSEASVDYPDYGFILADAIAHGEAERGIALCGSGVGIAIAMNRNAAVRCALVSEPVSARVAREHNDANAIALGARMIGTEMAKACVEAFLTAGFAAGRHAGRVEKLGHPPLPASRTTGVSA
jgi:ribose 5-phosphate isomerase B